LTVCDTGIRFSLWHFQHTSLGESSGYEFIGT
jgi:hypothetical protein